MLKSVRTKYGAEKRGTKFVISDRVFLRSYVYVCVVDSVVLFLDAEGFM